MIEIVFGYGTGGMLMQAGLSPENVYCFDPNLSKGNLMEKPYPDLTELRLRAENGESLRIWYSHDPDEMTGFFWLMYELEDLEEIQIHGITLPPYFECANGDVIVWEKWEEVAPEEWSLFLSCENPIPRNYRRGCALEWQQMLWENTPFRAMVNGKLVSASETLYDCFLRKDIAPAAYRNRR